ncbi:hypothetical protein QBC40DRAFT_235205 [Triangularia verruculosa]|uniref:Uncharacterized protein n=1 Tax=Triangularia verruculosa TaxID=2587418 RepID=A0AAN6XCE0_9PEZI|nr:hypothetical protein QBC40DRAFT_235205 [Triangularia verruculosa]
MPHLGWIPLASNDREVSGYVFCKSCELSEQNTDLAQDYCLHHRPGPDETPEEIQVEHAIKTTLLAEVQKLGIQGSPMPPADPPRPQQPPSGTEENTQGNEPAVSRPPSPPKPKQHCPSESSQQVVRAKPSTSIHSKPRSDRKGPGRRAENLRPYLANPPPIPLRGERPDPEEMARYGVIIPKIPLIPGVRPSKQPGKIAAELAMNKALRKCTNCHRYVEDGEYSKCCACRRAGNERAKRYQARKREQKEQREAALGRAPQLGTNSKECGQDTAPRTPSDLPTITTAAALASTQGRSNAETKDGMYMALIDRLELVHRRSGDQRAPAGESSRSHDINLEILDKLTGIRLLMTAPSPERRQTPPAPAQQEHSQGTEQKESPQQPERHHRTPPREQLHYYSNDYFAPSHHHTPQGGPSETSSSSIPTPAQSSPFSSRNSRDSSRYRSETISRGQEPQLRPLPAGAPPEQWPSSPTWHSTSVIPELPSRAFRPALPPTHQTTGPSPLMALWRASPQYRCLGLVDSEDDGDEQGRDGIGHDQDRHRSDVFGDNRGSNSNSNIDVSPGWVDGPSRELVDAAGLVDPALMYQSVDHDDVDLGYWLNLSELEKGSD